MCTIWRLFAKPDLITSPQVSSFHNSCAFIINYLPHIVNQIELHPYIDRNKILDCCKQHGIVVEAYSPLVRGRKLKDPLLLQIAEK